MGEVFRVGCLPEACRQAGGQACEGQDCWGLAAEPASSDGQYFPVGGPGGDTGDRNAKYGHAPGVQFYTHLSGQYGPFSVKVISAATGEAPHVLDGLLYHESEITPTTHHTDPSGVNEHV